MIYVLAAIGAITVAVLLWRAFGAHTAAGEETSSRPVAPDDDPDFLRQISQRQRDRRDEDDR